VKIRELRIRNFRCFKELTIPLDDCTVIFGENNCGKSAVLDAIRLSLSRRQGRRDLAFNEYDFHMFEKEDDPKTSPGIVICILFQEEHSDEWPESIVQSLNEIIQTEPYTDIDSITLQVTCKYDPDTKSYEASWEFLAFDGQPLKGKASSRANLSALVQFLPVFYLSALRDVAEEFSARSQFWGRLLKSVEIPEEKRAEIEKNLEELNAELLNADPRLSEVSEMLANMKSVVASGSAVAIRALPLRTWDLMSKSEIVLQGRPVDPWLPLTRHGQGVQSLAVLFLGPSGTSVGDHKM